MRVSLLGGEVDLITREEFLHFVAERVEQRQATIIANHNAHSLSLRRTCPEMDAFFKAADLVQLDSMPLVAWGRWLSLPITPEHRSTYLDWRDDFWRLANEQAWRVYYLGGASGVAEMACASLRQDWPRIGFACHDGYFDDACELDGARVVAAIQAHDPHILFVGMGMPRQELWISRHRSELERSVVFSVGAAFDYEAGAQRPAPRWAGRIGCEWLFRLLSQPVRLAGRYLLEPWSLLPVAIDDVRKRQHTANEAITHAR